MVLAKGTVVKGPKIRILVPNGSDNSMGPKIRILRKVVVVVVVVVSVKTLAVLLTVVVGLSFVAVAKVVVKSAEAN